MPGEPKEFSRAVENIIAAFRQLPDDEGRSRRRPTRDLGPLIEELLVKHRVGRESVEHDLRARWGELVGPANASYSHPLVIERNLLIVLVSHSVVRNELFLHRDAILGRIRQVPGCGAIKGLVLRTG